MIEKITSSQINYKNSLSPNRFSSIWNSSDLSQKKTTLINSNSSNQIKVNKISIFKKKKIFDSNSSINIEEEIKSKDDENYFRLSHINKIKNNIFERNFYFDDKNTKKLDLTISKIENSQSNRKVSMTFLIKKKIYLQEKISSPIFSPLRKRELPNIKILDEIKEKKINKKKNSNKLNWEEEQKENLKKKEILDIKGKKLVFNKENNEEIFDLQNMIFQENKINPVKSDSPLEALSPLKKKFVK